MKRRDRGNSCVYVCVTISHHVKSIRKYNNVILFYILSLKDLRGTVLMIPLPVLPHGCLLFQITTQQLAMSFRFLFYSFPLPSLPSTLLSSHSCSLPHLFFALDMHNAFRSHSTHCIFLNSSFEKKKCKCSNL